MHSVGLTIAVSGRCTSYISSSSSAAYDKGAKVAACSTGAGFRAVNTTFMPHRRGALGRVQCQSSSQVNSQNSRTREKTNTWNHLERFGVVGFAGVCVGSSSVVCQHWCSRPRSVRRKWPHECVRAFVTDAHMLRHNISGFTSWFQSLPMFTC
jgi:hypothetical protein